MLTDSNTKFRKLSGIGLFCSFGVNTSVLLNILGDGLDGSNHDR